MKIIVTGGAGFIGSHLVDALAEQGHEILVIDNLSTGNLRNLAKSKGKYELERFDISSEEQFIVGKYDVMFHLAALPRVQLSLDQPIETNAANVTGTLRMLVLAKKLGVKKFIYASSSSVYGDQEFLPIFENAMANPKNPYALQKFMGELYAKMFSEISGINIFAMRFFNVYGSRMATEGAYKLVFSNWIESIRKGEPMKIFGDGKQTRDFTHVSDVVRALIMAMGYEFPKNKTYYVPLNIGSGEETSVHKLSELFGYPSMHVEAREWEEKRKLANVEAARDMLGWIPQIKIKEGVKLIKEEYDI